MDKTFDVFWETEVPENKLIILRTNLKGIITYVNETSARISARISGYVPEELIGKPLNIIRHPGMPTSVFEESRITIDELESPAGKLGVSGEEILKKLLENSQDII